jgi:hypothetical protein
MGWEEEAAADRGHLVAWRRIVNARKDETAGPGREGRTRQFRVT